MVVQAIEEVAGQHPDLMDKVGQILTGKAAGPTQATAEAAAEAVVVLRGATEATGEVVAQVVQAHTATLTAKVDITDRRRGITTEIQMVQSPPRDQTLIIQVLQETAD